MHKVLDHIDRQLDKPLDLESLAEVAHFSPFHFHRLFAAWMGETLGDYLRRRRIEVAAMRLSSQPRLSVLTAAISVGQAKAKTRLGIEAATNPPRSLRLDCCVSGSFPNDSGSTNQCDR